MDAAGGSVVIRRIRPDEGLLLRDLRLRSVTDSPTAFGQTIDDVTARPELDWHRSALRASRGDGRIWLLADVGGRFVGLVQGRRRLPGTLLVFSMWVDPGARRTGLGERLITELETWARRWHASETLLWVLAGNAEGLAFYRRLGFTTVEAGPDAESGMRYGAVTMHRSIAGS
jgi:GNAT superfamily N-acetyltransferase